MVRANIRCVLRLRPTDLFDESLFAVGSDKQARLTTRSLYPLRVVADNMLAYFDALIQAISDLQTITVGRRGADAGRDANAASVRACGWLTDTWLRW